MSLEKDTITTKVNIPEFKPLGNEEFKKLKLNQKQKEIIFGSTLGDLYLQSQSQGKSYRLRIQQNFAEHGSYVIHLFDVFKDFCSSLPDKVIRKKNNTIDLRFQSRVHPDFFPIAKMFYKDNKKCVPSYNNVNQWLTNVALAYWYMDDGGIDGANPRGCSLNTQGFSFENVDMLIDILNKKYDLNAKERLNKEKKIIVFPADSCDKLNSIIKPHTHKSMYYKLPGYKKIMT